MNKNAVKVLGLEAITVSVLELTDENDKWFSARAFNSVDQIGNGKQPSLVLATDWRFPGHTMILWPKWFSYKEIGIDVVGLFSESERTTDFSPNEHLSHATFKRPIERVLEALRKEIPGLKEWEGRIPIFRREHADPTFNADLLARKEMFELIG